MVDEEELPMANPMVIDLVTSSEDNESDGQGMVFKSPGHSHRPAVDPTGFRSAWQIVLVPHSKLE